VATESIDRIGVDPQSDLLLDRPEKDAASGSTPIQLLGDVTGVDLIVGHRRQRIRFRALIGGSNGQKSPSS
jgi:hypothetical protein